MGTGIVLGVSTTGPDRAHLLPERVKVHFLHGGLQEPQCVKLEAIGDDEQDPVLKRIIFLRHAQGEHNLHPGREGDYPDPLLTALGHAQASSWPGYFGSFAGLVADAKLVLVSPLKRT